MQDIQQYIQDPNSKISVTVYAPIKHMWWWLVGHICEWLYDTYEQDELDAITDEEAFVCVCKRSHRAWRGWFDDGYGLNTYAGLAKIFELDDLEEFTQCELNYESLELAELAIVDGVVRYIWEDIEDEPRSEKLKELVGLAYENIYPSCKDVQKEYMNLR